ncbi:unnamed protein product [marine sediment metagenome]|uniref:Polysaccharide biosynthesis protein CapD-like domain-containing protein n=1 Tax=marine sediment metagenome TaxID=412755 RepID=X1KIX0_9ZZZZ
MEVAKGGEIFVPANVQSKKIVDLAKEISDDLEVVGVRPGEKIAEKLISGEEQGRAIRVGDMWVIR